MFGSEEGRLDEKDLGVGGWGGYWQELKANSEGEK